MEHREEGEAQEEGETERHAAATGKPVTAALRDIPPKMRMGTPRLESAMMHYVRLKKRKTCGGTGSAMMRLKMCGTGRPLL